MATVPPTMSPRKLRTIAGWLDTYERFIRHVIPNIEGDPSKVEAIVKITHGSEVQDDLKAWAAHLDHPPMPSIFRGIEPKKVWAFLIFKLFAYIVFAVYGFVSGLTGITFVGGIGIGVMTMMIAWVHIDTYSHPDHPCIGCD